MEGCTSTTATTEYVLCTLHLRQCGWGFVQKPRRAVIKTCHVHGLCSCQDCAWHTGRAGTGQIVSDGACCTTELPSQLMAPWGIIYQGAAGLTVNPETYTTFPCLCDQCPNSTRNLLNTALRSTCAQERSMHINSGSHQDHRCTVPVACWGREQVKGMFLCVVLSWSSGACRHIDKCSTIVVRFPRLSPRTVDPGTKGMKVLGCLWMSCGLGGVFSPPLKISSRSLWQGHAECATSEVWFWHLNRNMAFIYLKWMQHHFSVLSYLPAGLTVATGWCVHWRNFCSGRKRRKQ